MTKVIVDKDGNVGDGIKFERIRRIKRSTGSTTVREPR